MGEAKVRQGWREKFLVEHPRCCFCSGKRLADTVDHIPSRQLFRGKDRPTGLEVPACKECNSRTSKHEQVAALLARSYPNPTTQQDKMEVGRIAAGIRNNNPGLLEEMLTTTKKQRREPRKLLWEEGVYDAVTVNASGPLLNESMQIFGAKLGFGMHYHHTTNIIPEGGGAVVGWCTNYNRASGDFPLEEFSKFPAFQPLKQGRKDSTSQFEYSYQTIFDGQLGMYAATFRMSFAIFIGVAHDVAHLPDQRLIHKPFV